MTSGRVGATSATAFALHLRPGAREWFLAYLTREHPALLGAYAELYAGGAYVLRSYAADLARRVAPLLRRHGLGGPSAGRSTSRRPDPPSVGTSAPMLF